MNTERVSERGEFWLVYLGAVVGLGVLAVCGPWAAPALLLALPLAVWYEATR